MCSEKYPILYGCTQDGCEELHNVKEVAEFICREGMKGDVRIVDADSCFFLDTFGIYINRIVDMEYRLELLEVLIPMQQKLDGTEEFLNYMEATL